MTQVTRMTVKRPDGTIETVERPGHVTDNKIRQQFTDATRAAGRGEIIGWQIVGPAITFGTRPLIRRGGISDGSTRRCRGCGRIGDDGECGLGDY